MRQLMKPLGGTSSGAAILTKVWFIDRSPSLLLSVCVPLVPQHELQLCLLLLCARQSSALIFPACAVRPGCHTFCQPSQTRFSRSLLIRLWFVTARNLTILCF
jgi:hypothetical protein